MRLWLLAIVVIASAVAEAATVTVDGAGFLRDRDLREALKRLLDTKARATLDANAIEDGAVILGSTLGDQGYQAPQITIGVRLADGTKKEFVFDPTFATPLPRPLEASVVDFRLRPGVRSYVAAVEIVGLTAMSASKGSAYFRTTTTLAGNKRINAYSPGKVNRAVDGLEADLRQRGYAAARVRAEKTQEANGAVKLRVEVEEGPLWQITDVRIQRDEGDPVPLPETAQWINRPWTPTLEQNVREALRQAYYKEGYPDVGVHVAADDPVISGGVNQATIVATLVPGPKVAVGGVRFEGKTITRESVLRRRVRLGPGAPLNPVELERSRYRISRLGVFESVDLRYEPTEGTPRDPIFTLRDGPRYETNLLFGYGSYEQFRAGIEYRQMNILGLAHQSRLEAVQSVKSTRGEYTYTVPELFGESLDGTMKVFGLQRKEIAVLLQEFGVNASLRRPIARIGGDATLGYTFSALRNRNNTLSSQATDENQIVAAVNVGLTGDRRDNPLRPRRGYHWSTQLEAADPKFGGEVTYQRYEVSGAYHTGWGGGRWIHLGLTHGVITTFGARDDLSLPVNKRFFPGGDNSIRGYQRGEAAPRGPDGRFTGAKAYFVANLELEQAITPTWSVVLFGDGLGTAGTLRDYPFGERLYSIGLGLRYQTLIGPVRLEYGRNVNPRPGDPPGTWQISIGYPF